MIKKKLLKQLARDETAIPNPLSNMRKALSRKVQSQNALVNEGEEVKRSCARFGDSFANQLAEAPPKDNNERVERLLAKLENASHMTDMEEISRELRYLE